MPSPRRRSPDAIPSGYGGEAYAVLRRAVSDYPRGEIAADYYGIRKDNIGYRAGRPAEQRGAVRAVLKPKAAYGKAPAVEAPREGTRLVRADGGEIDAVKVDIVF